MSELLTPEKMGLFLMFSVPGIIILYIRAQFITGRMPPIAEGAISYLTLSLIYQAVAYPITSDVTPWFPPARIRARQLCCA